MGAVADATRLAPCGSRVHVSFVVTGAVSARSPGVLSLWLPGE